jgi:hypothetical protein
VARSKKIKEEKYKCKTEEPAQTIQHEEQSSSQTLALHASPAYPVDKQTTAPIIEQDAASKESVRRRFGPYRQPTEETKPKFKAIQEAALIFAEMIVDVCPDCQQRSTALTLLEQARMMANASIAIHCIPTTAKKSIQV